MKGIVGRGALVIGVYGATAFFASLGVNAYFGLAAQVVCIPLFALGGTLIGTASAGWVVGR